MEFKNKIIINVHHMCIGISWTSTLIVTEPQSIYEPLLENKPFAYIQINLP